MSGAVSVRRELRPGDLGAIVAQHGRVYSREYGLDSSFEALVASSVASAALRGFPGPRDAIWIVELDGELAGSLALTDEGDGEARLRWFLLDAGLRGRGLGRRLVGELVARAEELGYARVTLETFGDLEAAARLYLEHGFELLSTETGPRWGRAQLPFQRYELAPVVARSRPSLGQSRQVPSSRP
jgi:GNAT superfamily N-acetyltransferase